MPRLWYTDDEVNDFHPIVEDVLNRALENCGYSDIAEVLHHPNIPNSTIVPDFAIKIRNTDSFVFIIEVKRNNRDCFSQRFQNQTRTYVTELSNYWDSSYQKYYCLTNIETISLFAERQGPISSCLLNHFPKSFTPFNPADHDVTQTVLEFQLEMESILTTIFNRQIPEWSNNWEQIIDSFYNNYESIKGLLPHNEITSKDLTLFELFRLMTFSYLKNFYNIRNSDNQNFFRNFPSQNNRNEFISRLSSTFDRVLRLDFTQIFSNYPDNIRIFPDNLTDQILPYYQNIILNLNNYSSLAVSENESPEYIFSMLTSKVYDKETMHTKGQIISDSELSSLLATLTIDSQANSVLDPCCGDAALLDACYDKILMYSLNENQNTSHNEILSKIHGIEIDPFLAQLATFRLVAKNLSNVNTDTEANINIGDTFLTPLPNQVDRIVMNPPFLRNDDPSIALNKEVMIESIESVTDNCFVTNARQPNAYFYFVNYVWHYLNDTGKAGFILMAKFLNNKDGQYIKDFMLDRVEALVLYPNNYFKDFRVTTLIVVLSKQADENVKFLRILDEELLNNPEEIKNILSNDQTVLGGDYTLKVVERNDLSSESNWKVPLIDPYDKLSSLNNNPLFEDINTFFDIGRGNAETKGGTTVIFPNFANEPYSSIDDNHLGYGIKGNRIRRSLILTEDDLYIEKAIHFPMTYDEIMDIGIEDSLDDDTGLIDLFNAQNNNPSKWKKVLNSSYNNTLTFDILIPRADRTKHICYYNPYSDSKIVLSTNFCCLKNFRNENPSINVPMQLKFIVAFLNSSFGQLQFEVCSGNQEGMRKIEQHTISQFKILDPRLLSNNEVENVIEKFTILNTMNQNFSGSEGTDTIRRELDISIGEIIFARDSLGFDNVEAFVDEYEWFLSDLVEDRRI